MKIVGYSDRFSVAPGEAIRFMVSTELPGYHAEIVRLIHGDPNPDGPGVIEEPVQSALDGEYPGRSQPYRHGSYIQVPDSPALRELSSFTLATWLFPTTPEKGVQGLLGTWSSVDDTGFGLMIDADGALALWLGTPGHAATRLSTATPLRGGSWYFAAAAYDATSGRVLLVQQPHPAWPLDATNVAVERTARPGGAAATGGPFMMAAYVAGGEASKPVTDGHFNGKLEAPRLFRAALTARRSRRWLEACSRPTLVNHSSLPGTSPVTQPRLGLRTFRPTGSMAKRSRRLRAR
jgi:N,N-dimethylformamidase